MVHSESHKKALKDGLLTQKQYDKLPEALLDGIIKSKRSGKGKKKTAPKKKPAPKKVPKGSHKMPDGSIMKDSKMKGKKGKKINM
tara:strand:- start:570 stop:824 length:255 start_codon:yes stop_codon:yes gene_type:complete